MPNKRTAFLTLPLRSLVTKGAIFSDAEVLCTGCTSELEQVRPGDLFVATNQQGDAHELAREAVERGAVAVLCERLLPLSVPQAIVEDSRAAFGYACHQLAGEPSRKIPVIGITGSLGKTTTALLTAAVLNTEKQGVAAFTSLAHCDSVRASAALQTTPRADELSGLLKSAVDRGCSHAVAEFSSAGLSEQRGAGMELAVAVLTNLRRQHLDRHNTLAAYRAAKERIFSLLRSDGAAVINIDDPYSRSLLERLKCPALTVSLHHQADVTATLLERCASEQTFLLEAGADSVPVRTRMVGDHHIHNCLSATAVGLLSGLDLPTIARGLEAVAMIPGRMERLECGQDFAVYIDEARSHDGLAMCLKTARQVTPGRVICVMSPSASGDPSERPLLGRVLEKSSQVRVITSEASAHMNALGRAHEVLDGFENPGQAHVIPSRDKAIAWAMEHARFGDAVVICGQGHRDWKLGSRTTDDSTFARERLYEIVARDVRSKPLVFAYSG